MQDAFARWLQLREQHGRRIDLVELYELYAAQSGRQATELDPDERAALWSLMAPVDLPGFELTAGSGRAQEPIEVVEYDLSWPTRFAEWRDRLRSVLGVTAIAIEHIGSTSVPDLPAKPVIDIQVSVADLEDEVAYVPPIESLGLRLRSRDVWHRFFRPIEGRPRDVHVHVSVAGSDWERDHLNFRDLLRRDAAARDAYMRAKRQAARDWGDDRLAYTAAKSAVILDLLEGAGFGIRGAGDLPDR